ncbi:hypothetical protein TNCV_3963471 [Trichonephila clavipes]|nr:hypothetical protein TNCV_3963471 [Trichonephila clavipes]
MAFSLDHPTDMEFQQVSLPLLEHRLLNCQQIQLHVLSLRSPRLTSEDASLSSRYIYKNVIRSLRPSNVQDVHDPTFVQMTKQLIIYENLLEKLVSDFGSLPHFNTPECPRRHQLVLPQKLHLLRQCFSKFQYSRPNIQS